MDNRDLLQIQQHIGYSFSNPNLLDLALAHASSAQERLESNERLEFLGDSVLALVTCERLFEQFPDYLEGDLTKIKSKIVSRKTCAQVANNLGLTDYIQAGKGMAQTRAMSGSIAAGALEAVIAAIYLDGGFEAAREFILSTFGSMMDQADAEQHHDNFKSMLQQYAQRQMQSTPIYELLDEKGPDHNKCFETAVVIDNQRFPSAWGVTKKEAEQKAALNALIELKLVPPEERQSA